MTPRGELAHDGRTMPERKSTDRARKALAKGRAREQFAREQAAMDHASGKYTPEQLEDMGRWRADFDAFMADNLWVPHIDGGEVVPFTPNVGQQDVSRVLRAARGTVDLESGRASQCVKAIILKSRKWGISTWCQGLAYWKCSTRPWTNGLIIAHKKDSTGAIFDTTKRFYMLDERRPYGLRPLAETSNRLEMKFGNPDHRTRELYPGLQSKIEITSAESKEPGRSGTYHFVHASEVAFWPEGEGRAIWKAVGPAFMEAPDSIAIMESTANGVGGLFYETWMDAVAGKNGWLPIFLSWLKDRRCRRYVSPEEANAWDWEDTDEREYAERHKLTLEQAKFRRMFLHDPAAKVAGKEPADVFDEEYPASPEVAFKSSGKLFFLARTLEALKRDPEKGLRAPLWRGHIRNRGGLEARGPHNPRFPIDIVTDVDAHGPLRVWAEPKKDRDYVIGGDIAEGLVHGDNHCIVVLDRHELEVAAVWKTNRATSREAGQVASLLGWWYGGAKLPALVGIELNAHGVAAIQEAVRILYPYLWFHRDVRKPGEPPSERPGWITSDAVRTYMLETVEFEIRAANIKPHHSEFYKEAEVFEVLDGKPQARSGHHDDEILATAIALQMHLHAGPPGRVPQHRVEHKGPRRLVPDFPEVGKVPISQLSGKLRRVNKGGMWD